ncbi:MAG: membrane protein insertase YidC, partial [Bacteroidales bacterium]|nr:membrane protein insertase YidC [Bacteroidales bacterium]
MDRNSITGIILIAVILIGYSILTKPQREEMAEQRRVADSIRMAERALAAESESLPLPQTQPADSQSQSAGTQVQPTAGSADYGVFSAHSVGEDAFYTIENEKILLRISRKGGKPYSLQLKEYQTYDSLPLMLFEGIENQFGLEFFADGKTIRTN